MEFEYRRLKTSWEGGRCEREDALHLLFLAWMHWADPPFVTGLEKDPGAGELWCALFDHFGGEHAEDAEFLYVAASMASIFHWGVNDEHDWSSRAKQMRARLLRLKPEGFSPDCFEGRGEYGEYFAHLTSVQTGL